MKFTKKQFAGYHRAKRDWITANDSYNLDVYGITEAQYGLIRKVEKDLHGIGGGPVSLFELNREVKELGAV
jgi:hypothetical protein